MYPDMGSEEMGGEGAAGSAEDNGKDSNAPETETTLVPKSIFPEEPEPGKVCEFEVVHVYEKEVELKYKKDEKKPTEMSGAEGRIDQMAMGNMGGEEGE